MKPQSQTAEAIKSRNKRANQWARFVEACECPKFRLAAYVVAVNRLRSFKPRRTVTAEHKRMVARRTGKRWREKNREKHLAQMRENARRRRRSGKDGAYLKKYRQDPVVRLKWINRSRIHSAIQRQSASKMVRSIVGCDAKRLRAHIESQFQPGMHWGNQGKVPGTWQLDHVRPLASFDLKDIEQQKQAFHYTNLRPTWFEDNSEKSSIWNGRKWRHSDHGKALVA